MRWVWLFLFYLQPAAAQVRDDFSDGDFTANPPWRGTPGAWTVSADGVLQSRHDIPNSSFYLSTPSSLALAATWEWSLALDFNTSSTNYVDLYLASSLEDLTATGNTGYFIRVGGAADEVSLYRRDGATTVLLIDGKDGVTDRSSNTLHIRAARNAAGRFVLFRGGESGTFFAEGEATDVLYLQSAYTGIVVRQSTASFFNKHALDEVSIDTLAPDGEPPQWLGGVFINATVIDLLFDEPLGRDAANPAHFTVRGMGTPQSATLDEWDGRRLRIQFALPFAPGIHTLDLSGIRDAWGNLSSLQTIAIEYYRARMNDVIIHEILPDPSPPAGLPEAEYVELYNRSGHVLSLQGWRLQGSTQGAVLPAMLLPPDSFVILCSPSHATALSRHGAVLPLPGFPSLPNEGGTLWIEDAEGRTLHAISYSGEQFEGIKSGGGWSLEMVDARFPCAGPSNWSPSVSASGGTPGRANSVAAPQADETPPRLLRTFALDSLQLVAVFDKPLDSFAAAVPRNYTFNRDITVAAARPLPPLFTEVLLQLDHPLQRGEIYTLRCSGIMDCSGNAIGAFHEAPAGLPLPPEAGMLVINEMLFNPRPGGVDYVELYHRGSAPVDAMDLRIGRKDVGGTLPTVALSARPYLIFPGDHIIVTENIKAVQAQYFVPPGATAFSVPGLPSFPDDAGHCVLLDRQGNELDALAYEDDWHFPFIADREGVALERIDPAGPTQQGDNWHSAASTSGYGTPGRRNSQLMQPGATANVEVQPKIISPDNDGHEDVLTITCSMDRPGAVANVLIFDLYGNAVRHLVKNGLMGEKGQWKWDGTGENARRLAAGMYIVLVDLFDVAGKRSQFKRVVALAGAR